MVQPYYDSLVAKLIITANDRESAIRRAIGAIDEYVIEGIRTTLPLQRRLLSDPAFADVDFTTKTVDRWLAARDR